MRDGLIVSTIGGIAVEISESVFAATFALPTEGLADLSEVPRNFISDAQSLFSVSEKEVSISCLKKEMKMQYRFLSDILAKSLFVKARSFDVVTRDRFLLMTAITFDVKVNWGSLLFGVLKEMVTPDSRQAKGYAIQICVLLKNIPGLELGESKAFPAPRILNEKTVHIIVSVNDNVGVEEVAEAPRAKKTPVKKIVSKKRPAAHDAESKELRLGSKIPVAGVATGEQIPAAEDDTEDADATIKLVLNRLDLVFEKPDVAQGGLVETWFDKAFDEEFEIADRERQDTEEEIVVGFEKRTSAGDQPPASDNGADGTNDDESLSIEEHQARIPFNASLPSTLAPPITQIRFGQGIEFRDVDAYTPTLPRIDISDKGKGILVEDDIQGHPARETFSLICADIEFLIALREKVIEDVSIFPAIETISGIESSSSGASTVYRSPSPILQEVNYFALEPVAPTDDQEELLYSVEVPHSPSPVVQVPESPSSSSVSPVHFDSADINLDNTAKAQSSLPAASVDLSSILDALQASLCQRMDDANNEFLSRLHSTERSLQTSLDHQKDYLRRLIEGARQEGQTQDDIQLLRLNELRKYVMAHDVKADTDSLDVRNKFIALDAKFRSLDGQIATIRNDQLEFQTKIAANILGLSTQISEIADYIRSGDGKKGEIGSSSRRPLLSSKPSSHVQGSAVRTQTFPPTTGTFVERVEQARRHLIESGQVISTEEAAERVIEADRQESDRPERERARERRERRLSRSGAYKRRRG
ncbi:hypothetical protein F511_44288 [Dorcoceras hygrometricum]|uniref:Dystroglycan-like n=1 Tax=Dorcoceras hygrometricum TaxID=472368 RepID=A0A2Z7CQK1_9LAMI|nr:hypothetical protein F511_44288 [Dorcoceras hygrometricum]